MLHRHHLHSLEEWGNATLQHGCLSKLVYHINKHLAIKNTLRFCRVFFIAFNVVFHKAGASALRHQNS